MRSCARVEDSALKRGSEDTAEDLAALAPPMQWALSVGQKEPPAVAVTAMDWTPPADRGESAVRPGDNGAYVCSADGPALWRACSFQGASKQNHPCDQALVGRRVRVHWEDDHEFFEGTVTAFDSATQRHTIVYDDGDQQNESLQVGDVCTWELRLEEDEDGQASAPPPAPERPSMEAPTPELDDVAMESTAPAIEKVFMTPAQATKDKAATQAAPDPAHLATLWRACSFQGASKQNHPCDQALVGRRVRVHWEDDHEFFEGTVTAFDSATQRHTIVYDDGDQQNESLQVGDVCTWELRLEEDEDGQASAPPPAPERPSMEAPTPELDDVAMESTAPAIEKVFMTPAQAAQDEAATRALIAISAGLDPAPDPDHSSRGDSASSALNTSLTPRLKSKKMKSALNAQRMKRSLQTSIPKVAPSPPKPTRAEVRRRVSERSAAAEEAHRERSKAMLARSTQSVQAAIRVGTSSRSGAACDRAVSAELAATNCKSPPTTTMKRKRTQERLRLGFWPL